MHKVMVYGTLKFGGTNHSLLKTAEFVGKAETYPLFTLISMGWFPAALVHGDNIIKGEVYKVDDDTLQELDWLEGHPNFYRRIKVGTNLGETWMYVLNNPSNTKGYQTIKSGEWLFNDRVHHVL